MYITRSYRRLLDIILNLLFGVYIVWIYAEKLININSGKVNTSLTGLDGLITELISFILCIICIAGVSIIISSVVKKGETIIKIFDMFVLMSVAVWILGIIISIIGKSDIIFTLVPIVIASAFIKLRQVDLRKEGAALTIFGYVWLYIICFVIPLCIIINLGSISNFEQTNIFLDAIAALTYYIIIAFVIPMYYLIRGKMI